MIIRSNSVAIYNTDQRKTECKSNKVDLVYVRVLCFHI